MEITGKIINVLPPQSGQGRNGTWKKQEYIIEIPGQYPKKVCISAWGDKIDQFNITSGETITASIEIESREFNQRWYTEVKVWKVQKNAGGEKVNSGSSYSFEPGAEPLDLDDSPF